MADSLTGLPKLADANNAGTKNAKDCTLILTEGDSAKALAVAGLGVVGRDNFGVFPLRGKLLNVREARHDQIMKNEEIQNIKKIMGLQHSKEYTNVSSLRYGRLMIMTDQVCDITSVTGNSSAQMTLGSRRVSYQGASHQLFGPLLSFAVESTQFPGRVRYTYRQGKSEVYSSG